VAQVDVLRLDSEDCVTGITAGSNEAAPPAGPVAVLCFVAIAKADKNSLALRLKLGPLILPVVP